jgi:hypothetical protein
MRILFTIPHFFKPSEAGRYGSVCQTPQRRIQALTSNLSALHQLYNQSQCIINIAQRLALPANQSQAHEIKVIICTSQNDHLLNQLPLSPQLYSHHPTQAEPMLLGFECQAVLRDCLGQYDYYCYLEDDLILHDPWFFIKLKWFTQQVGELNLLQPNRYEVSSHGVVHKAYIDGDLAAHVTAKFQNVQEKPELIGTIMETPVTFRRPLNPHSGCYFLTANQMVYWVKQPYFLDRDTSFVGSLESAATLGIMKTFHIYKPTPHQAGFLEIQHFGTSFISLIGNKVKLDQEELQPVKTSHLR